MPGMAAHYERFIAYARSFRTGDKDHDARLCLKEEHTLGVLVQAEGIAGAEAVFRADPALCRALLLAALYHDLARFPQYARYHTFSDARSVNHGRWASRELGRLGFLDGEEPAVRRRARAAVLLHNRYALPGGLPEDILAVCQAVRDADKLDILRVMRANLGEGMRPDPVVIMNAADSQESTPHVLERVMARQLASFADIATATDFRLLLCGWFYDLNFAASRRMAVRTGNLHAILAVLSRIPAMASFVWQYSADLDACAP
jgi:hypothetical protein